MVAFLRTVGTIMFASTFLSLCIVFFAILIQTKDSGGSTAPYCYSKDKNAPVNVAWKCDQPSGRCSRVHASDSEYDTLCLTSLDVCNLICNSNASLWPLPTGNVSIEKTLLSVSSVSFDYSGNKKQQQLLEALESYFIATLGNWSEKRKPEVKLEHTVKVLIKIAIRDEETNSLTLDTDESYHLTVEDSEVKNISTVNVIIVANTYFGARHGIETLLQLLVRDEMSRSLLIPSHVDIGDAPAYKHRGLLLDTSRNFYSVKAIKRLLDGMAYNKLNVFHWHMTDSHSFPYQSKNFPDMDKIGAYSSSQVYTPSDIRDLVEYARVRGIKVLPELDAPSHVGEGWQLFEKDVLLCFNSKPWDKYCAEPPCGILNPVNERVYEILGGLYSEWNELFDSDMFHMGGDEIKFACWKETNSVVKWLSERNMSQSDDDFLRLWARFQERAVNEIDKSAKNATKQKIILWTSLLTESKLVKELLDPNRYVIQIWTTGDDRQIVDLLNKGYQIIMSNYDALYFDCGFGGIFGTEKNNNWCSPYKSWQTVYSNDPLRLIHDVNKSSYPNSTADYHAQILGAEAALWSEQVDERNMDSRLWPRGAALGERLWSNPTTDWRKAEGRLLRHRERMVGRGIDAEVIEPFWCHQNGGECE